MRNPAHLSNTSNMLKAGEVRSPNQVELGPQTSCQLWCAVKTAGPRGSLILHPAHQTCKHRWCLSSDCPQNPQISCAPGTKIVTASRPVFFIYFSLYMDKSRWKKFRRPSGGKNNLFQLFSFYFSPFFYFSPYMTPLRISSYMDKSTFLHIYIWK